MEVVLKKTKLTASILKQSLRASIDDFENGEVLGWCVYSYDQYILLYRKDISAVKKYLLFNGIKKTEEGGQHEIPVRYLTKVNFGNNKVELTYTESTAQRRDSICEILENAKKSALDKGQIYI